MASKALSVINVASTYSLLKITKRDGSVIEGSYVGCRWVRDHQGRHACIVRLETPDDDWGATIYASQIDDVEGVEPAHGQ